MRLGFYDEALGAIRNVGEIANLLFLFFGDATAPAEWTQLSEERRRHEFSPVRVRRRLEEVGSPVPVDQDRYRTLSRVATHVGPGTRPQAYNPLSRPSLAPMFQEAGVLLVLNELAVALACVALAGPRLIPVGTIPIRRFGNEAQKLGEAIGGVTVDEIDNMWAALRDAE